MSDLIYTEKTLTIQNVKNFKESLLPSLSNYEKSFPNKNEIEISLKHLIKFDGAGFQFLIAIMKDSRIKLIDIPEAINKKFAYYGF